MIFWTPAFFIIRREDGWKIVKMWGYSHLWLQYQICGTRFDFRGLDNIPKGNLLVAPKHQSSWETYTMLLFFDDPSYVLKRELMRIPLFGWYAIKMKVVAVDRGKRGLALASMSKNASEQMSQDERQIILYPEGTRTIPGVEARYKYGLTHLYSELDCPVLPAALNSGLYWGRQTYLRYPGTIILEFLEPIKPGLKKEVFSKKLGDVIETASDRLIQEAATSNNPPPLAIKLAKNLA